MCRLWLILALLPSIGYSKPKAKPKVIIHPTEETQKVLLAFTNEVDVYDNTTTFNTNLVLSLEDGWDIGVSLQNLPIRQNQESIDSLNYQSDFSWIINKTYSYTYNDIVIGVQQGFHTYLNDRVPDSNINSLQQFYFIDNVIKLLDGVKVHFGSYYASREVSNTVIKIDLMGGIDIKLLDDYQVKVDTFRGENNVAATNLTVTTTIVEPVTLYTGFSAPMENSGNYWYWFLGFTVTTGQLP